MLWLYRHDYIYKLFIILPTSPWLFLYQWYQSMGCVVRWEATCSQCFRVPRRFDLGVTLTLNFQGQTWNLLYQPKWFDCQKIKSTHIDWTESLNDHQVWPWPWPWKVRCMDLPDSNRGDFRYRSAVDSSSCRWSHVICHSQHIVSMVATFSCSQPSQGTRNQTNEIII